MSFDVNEVVLLVKACQSIMVVPVGCQGKLVRK